MPRYTVNATLYVPAWIVVTADDEDEAKQIAADSYVAEFDHDIHAATVEFNVEPSVEVA